jgi:hypothetical protein
MINVVENNIRMKKNCVSQRSVGFNLSLVLQRDCLWRFDWFENADNPQMRFKEVPCPAELATNTNWNKIFIRKDFYIFLIYNQKKTFSLFI